MAIYLVVVVLFNIPLVYKLQLGIEYVNVSQNDNSVTYVAQGACFAVAQNKSTWALRYISVSE